MFSKKKNNDYQLQIKQNKMRTTGSKREKKIHTRENRFSEEDLIEKQTTHRSQCLLFIFDFRYTQQTHCAHISKTN